MRTIRFKFYTGIGLSILTAVVLTKGLGYTADKPSILETPKWVEQGANAFPESRGKTIHSDVLRHTPEHRSVFKVLSAFQRRAPESLKREAEEQIYDKVRAFTSNVITRYTDRAFAQPLSAEEKSALIKEASGKVIEEFKLSESIAFMEHYDQENNTVYLLAVHDVSPVDYILMMMVRIAIIEPVMEAESKHGQKFSDKDSEEIYIKILREELLNLGLSAYVKRVWNGS